MSISNCCINDDEKSTTKSFDFYDINKNTKFKTYATYFIKGEIKHYLRDKANFIKPPREIQELSYKISIASP